MTTDHAGLEPRSRSRNVDAPRTTVLITSSYPITGDGSEAAGSFVHDLAHELARHAPCRVVAPGGESTVERETKNVQVYRYWAPSQPLSTLKPWHPSHLLAIKKVMRSGRRATLKAASKSSTARIIALWALPCGAWAREAERATGVPYAVWALGSDVWSLGRLPLVRGHLRRILIDAQRVFADGLKLSRATSSIAGRPVSFLPSTRSIDPAKATPPREAAPYRLAFLGRWHPNKGMDLLLDALDCLGDSRELGSGLVSCIQAC